MRTYTCICVCNQFDFLHGQNAKSQQTNGLKISTSWQPHSSSSGRVFYQLDNRASSDVHFTIGPGEYTQLQVQKSISSKVHAMHSALDLIAHKLACTHTHIRTQMHKVNKLEQANLEVKCDNGKMVINYSLWFNLPFCVLLPIGLRAKRRNSQQFSQSAEQQTNATAGFQLG